MAPRGPLAPGALGAPDAPVIPGAPIALSCGEPAGIGPEIAVAAWEALRGEDVIFLIGDPAHLPRGSAFVEIAAPEEAAAAMPRGLPVLARDFGAPRVPGVARPEHAPHVIGAIAEAVALVQAGRAAALCTAPIHKKALQDGAGFAFPGHTEYLAHLAGGREVAMMLACDALRVVPATIHIPLEEVPRALTPARLESCIRVTEAGLRAQGLARPRIAVAGLNPHAGEGGAMGTEERDWIAPLIEHLAGEGMAITGPHPADTMFHPPARARYDVAIAMYHDQALIPIKTLDFAGGMNVTLGLGFVRTSPDHGTAFDIAGQGVADASSLIAALRMAREMADETSGGVSGG
ncbi:MAG: 4-hydroxythreonine-4-phosphate dehydrogenase PdxA [Rhodobacterales bacterium]|nr:MAG: 4-hydroxythreonine-4-phosphate dehydrogenase PdxA [Rhodobacterales bacterium]